MNSLSRFAPRLLHRSLQKQSRHCPNVRFYSSEAETSTKKVGAVRGGYERNEGKGRFAVD